MMVYSLNEELGLIEPHRIIALLDMGVKPVFKLTTKDGKSIKTTGNHPYLVVKQGGENREEAAARRIRGLELKQDELDRQSLSGDRDISDGQMIWKLSPFVEDNKREINYQNNNGDNKKENVVHSGLPLANHYPYKDDQSYYSCDKIEGKKRHNFLGPIFDNIAAMLKNNTVMAMPIENVSNGALTTTPGTNIPTTNEANRILAPSKKKSANTSNLSLSHIQPKFTTETMLCQAEWTKVIYLIPGDLIAVYSVDSIQGSRVKVQGKEKEDDLSVFLQPRTCNLQRYVLWAEIENIEYIGQEQVYDITVEGTENFFGNGILAHNTYLNGNVGMGRRGLGVNWR